MGWGQRELWEAIQSRGGVGGGLRWVFHLFPFTLEPGVRMSSQVDRVPKSFTHLGVTGDERIVSFSCSCLASLPPRILLTCCTEVPTKRRWGGGPSHFAYLAGAGAEFFCLSSTFWKVFYFPPSWRHTDFLWNHREQICHCA